MSAQPARGGRGGVGANERERARREWTRVRTHPPSFLSARALGDASVNARGGRRVGAVCPARAARRARLLKAARTARKCHPESRPEFLGSVRTYRVFSHKILSANLARKNGRRAESSRVPPPSKTSSTSSSRRSHRSPPLAHAPAANRFSRSCAVSLLPSSVKWYPLFGSCAIRPEATPSCVASVTSATSNATLKKASPPPAPGSNPPPPPPVSSSSPPSDSPPPEQYRPRDRPRPLHRLAGRLRPRPRVRLVRDAEEDDPRGDAPSAARRGEARRRPRQIRNRVIRPASHLHDHRVVVRTDLLVQGGL